MLQEFDLLEKQENNISFLELSAAQLSSMTTSSLELMKTLRTESYEQTYTNKVIQTG